MFSKIFRLFCCPPFPSRIVAKLAFNPPECNYSFEKQDGMNKCDIYNLVLQDKTNINETETFSTENEINQNTHSKSSENLSSSQKYRVATHKLKHASKFKPENVDAYFVTTSANNRIAVVYAHPIIESKSVLLLSHGNAMDIGDSIVYVTYLCNILKCNIVTYDYSGYGISTGTASEANLYHDVEAVANSISEKYGYTKKQIILFGISIGSVPTVDLASKHDFAGVVIQSGLSTGLQIISPNLRQIACFSPFPSIEKVKNITSPVLVIHGMDDEIIRVNHGMDLYHNTKNKVPPLFCAGCGHNDVDLDDNYFPRLYKFIHDEI